MRWRHLLPLGLFLVLAAFLAHGLRLDPRAVPSPLVGKPVPPFRAALLARPGESLTAADLSGRTWILNVWASWCTPCREEHPRWVDFARRTSVPIYGLNYKDESHTALAWLRDLGDPYRHSLADRDGRIGIDFGVYGVPETFIIDRAGIVRFKHVGPITDRVLREQVEPLLRQLGA